MNTMVQTQKDSFFSWEVFFLGGCSVIVWLATWAFTERTANPVTMSQLAFGLAFAVNHPHFLSSYQLLYKDFRKNILAKPRYFWAAVVAPLLLASLLVYSFVAARTDFLGYILNGMFFLVGWHYVKQVFGCMIVTSARRKVYYGKWERRVLLSNLFSIWALSFLNGQNGGPYFTFYGITYPALGLSNQYLPYAYAFVGLTAVGMIGMHVRKYVEQGVTPTPAGLAAFGSLYVWYLPTLAHPTFAYLIPFFHSMQYLVFVTSFKGNQVAAQEVGLEPREKRLHWVRGFVGYMVSAAILGAMAFEFVPKFLDSQKLINNPLLGTSPFLAAFLIFINIHHYFIDNVMWRSDNEEVKKYLFAPPLTEAPKAAPTGKSPRAVA